MHALQKSCDTCGIPSSRGCSYYTAEECGPLFRCWEPVSVNKKDVILTPEDKVTLLKEKISKLTHDLVMAEKALYESKIKGENNERR